MEGKQGGHSLSSYSTAPFPPGTLPGVPWAWSQSVFFSAALVTREWGGLRSQACPPAGHSFFQESLSLMGYGRIRRLQEEDHASDHRRRGHDTRQPLRPARGLWAELPPVSISPTMKPWQCPADMSAFVTGLLSLLAVVGYPACLTL